METDAERAVHIEIRGGQKRVPPKSSILVITGVVLLFVSFLLLRFVLESGLSRELKSAVSNTFHGQLAIGSLKVGVFSRTLEVHGATISFPLSGTGQQSGPMTPLVTIRSVSGHFGILSLLNRVYDIEDLSLTGIRITAIDRGGRDNFRSFLSQWSSGAHGGGEGGATVRDFHIRDASVLLDQGNGDPILSISGLEGEIRPNLLMDRFRARFHSGPLVLHFSGGVFSVPRTMLSGSFDSGSLRNFRVKLQQDPSWISVEGRVTRISESPFLDLFFHGNLHLSGWPALFQGAKTPPATMKGVLRLDGYIHGPFDRWKGKALLRGDHLVLGGDLVDHLSVDSHFAPFLMVLDPVRIDAGKRHVHGSLSALFSGKRPTAQVDMTVREPAPAFLGAVPMSIRVTRTIPLFGRGTGHDPWKALWKKVMGDDFS